MARQEQDILCFAMRVLKERAHGAVGHNGQLFQDTSPLDIVLPVFQTQAIR
jgi:hypothetical protein